MRYGTYEDYRLALTPIAVTSPQAIGFTRSEYAQLAQDPRVVWSRLSGGEAVIPFLAPIDRYGWLNLSYFESHLREQMDRDVVRYATLLRPTSIARSDYAASAVRDLARDGGVLAVDYSNADQAAVEDLRDWLECVGVSVSGVDRLGRQTYFVGATRLIEGSDERRQSTAPKRLLKTYDERLAGNHTPQDGPAMLSAVSPDQMGQMYQFYERAYEVLNDDPCRQGLGLDEFRAMVEDDQRAVKVVNMHAGEVAAICILDEDHSRLTWVNDSFFTRRFGPEYVWFPGLAADPESPAAQNTQAMVDLIAESGYLGANPFILAFDCCERNTGFLDQFLQNMINQTQWARVEIAEVGHQQYEAWWLASA